MKKEILCLALSVCMALFVSVAYCQSSEAPNLVKLEGITVKISLSAKWQKMVSPKFEESVSRSALFMEPESKAIFSIEMYPLDVPVAVAKESAYQLDYWVKVKQQLQAEGIASEDATYFGSPALIVNRNSKDEESRTRELRFLRENKYFIIALSCASSSFENTWSDIDASIRGMEFIKDRPIKK